MIQNTYWTHTRQVSHWPGHKNIKVTHQISGTRADLLGRTRTVLDDARGAGREQPPNPETAS